LATVIPRGDGTRFGRYVLVTVNDLIGSAKYYEGNATYSRHMELEHEDEYAANDHIEGATCQVPSISRDLRTLRAPDGGYEDAQ